MRPDKSDREHMERVILMLRTVERERTHENISPDGCLKCLLATAIMWLTEYATIQGISLGD